MKNRLRQQLGRRPPETLFQSRDTEDAEKTIEISKAKQLTKITALNATWYDGFFITAG